MDLSAHPEVLEALDTTADPTKTRAHEAVGAVPSVGRRCRACPCGSLCGVRALQRVESAQAVARLLRRVECGVLEGDRDPLVGAFVLQLEVRGASRRGVPELGRAGEGRAELATVEPGKVGNVVDAREPVVGVVGGDDGGRFCGELVVGSWLTRASRRSWARACAPFRVAARGRVRARAAGMRGQRLPVVRWSSGVVACWVRSQ